MLWLRTHVGVIWSGAFPQGMRSSSYRLSWTLCACVGNSVSKASGDWEQSAENFSEGVHTGNCSHLTVLVGLEALSAKYARYVPLWGVAFWIGGAGRACAHVLIGTASTDIVWAVDRGGRRSIETWTSTRVWIFCYSGYDSCCRGDDCFTLRMGGRIYSSEAGVKRMHHVFATEHPFLS